MPCPPPRAVLARELRSKFPVIIITTTNTGERAQVKMVMQSLKESARKGLRIGMINGDGIGRVVLPVRELLLSSLVRELTVQVCRPRKRCSRTCAGSQSPRSSRSTLALSISSSTASHCPTRRSTRCAQSARPPCLAPCRRRRTRSPATRARSSRSGKNSTSTPTSGPSRASRAPTRATST